ncbi:uncharacterized protein LOC117111223 isoform X2 [Anneissia japonica]|uniref:uncharacterized protein LOC117111223 isoform X2 n=1 Tax=Anneissia japonica TaxID=1529436 RepID=UPI001425B286|nr:uncharacterized protein LOC117111223 isoform X2 [Anneissia japonica]
MKIYESIVLIAWIADSCYAANLIYTSKGVIDPNPYAVHSRRKRSSNFTRSEEQAILDKHNELRSGVSPEASNMNFMVWDEGLAMLAKEWSEECIWDHGFPKSNLTSWTSYGQNLWLGTGSADNKPNGVGATQAWYNEVSKYTYDTRACTGVCGHYTQVVWADSYAVGCGLAFCETTNDGHKNSWIITCNYGPPGNYNRHPYLSGPNCTQCSSGSGQCYNNLCRLCEDHNEECICNQQCRNCGTLNTTSCRCDCQPGFILDDCSAECEDRSSYCNAGWYRGQCSGYSYVREGCPLMCDECSPAPADFECDDVVKDPTTTLGDNNVEGNNPTTPPAGGNQCTEKECQNDGTFDTSTCKCACPSGYQGATCEESKEQVRNGVEITMSTSITAWERIVSSLLQSVASIVNKFCNSAAEYGRCCPNSGNRLREGDLNYVGTDDIFTGDGYPKSIDSSTCVTLIFVRPQRNNALCEAGTAKRKRRDINQLIQHRMKRDTQVYLDQEALYTAIVNNKEDIQTATGVQIAGVKRGEVLVEEQEDKDGGGMSDGAIAGIIIGVIAVTALVLAVAFFVYREKQKGKVQDVSNVKLTEAN